MKKTLLALAGVIASLCAAPSFAADYPPRFYKPPPMQSAPPVSPSPVGALALLPIANLGSMFIHESSTSIFTQTFHKSFKFPKWSHYGWKKVHYLKSHGWDVDIKKYSYKVKVDAHKNVQHTRSKAGISGKAVVACIMGSAFSLIANAAYKGMLNGSFYWRSQREWEEEVAAGVHLRDQLTLDEAYLASAFCGAGGVIVALNQRPKARHAVLRVGN